MFFVEVQTVESVSSFVFFVYCQKRLKHNEDVVNKERHRELLFVAGVMNVVVESIELIKALLMTISGIRKDEGIC